MYKKKLLLILVLAIALFSFNKNTNAVQERGNASETNNKAIEGYCIYHTKSEITQLKDLSFMLKQDTKGNITYYYYVGSKLKKDSSSKWKQDKDNTYSYKMDNDVSTPLEKCPNYIDYYIMGKEVTFHNMTKGTNFNNIQNISPYKATINKPVSNKDNSENSNSDTTTIIGEKVEMDTCEEVLGEDLVALLQDLVNIVKIAIPIILIVLGTLDFGKAILSSDENEMKKAQGTFIKRLIIAVAIFLIPSLLGVILDIANNIWGNIDTTLCGIEF